MDLIPIGEAARKLWEDAQAMLDQLIEHKWLRANAVFGLFPANAVDGDDIAVYSDESRSTDIARLFNLRQEFPTQWHRFLNPTDPANGNVFELEMSPNLLSFRDKGKNLKVNKIWLLARCAGEGGVRSKPVGERVGVSVGVSITGRPR